jgi:hypothetical protein
MTHKRILCLLSFLFTGLLAILFAGLFVLQNGLPVYLKSCILPSVGHRMDIGEVKMGDGGIGFGQLYIDGFRAGPKNNPFLTLDTIRLAYSFSSLWRGHFDKLIIIGPALRCAYVDKKFTIPGIDINKRLLPDVTQTKRRPFSFKLPGFTIDEIDIRKATVICQWEDKLIRLPFNMKLMVSDDLANSRFKVNWSITESDISCLADLVSAGATEFLTGRLDLKGYTLLNKTQEHMEASGNMDIVLAPFRSGPSPLIQTFAPITTNVDYGIHLGKNYRWRFALTAFASANTGDTLPNARLILRDFNWFARLAQLKAAGRSDISHRSIEFAAKLVDLTGAANDMRVKMPQALLNGKINFNPSIEPRSLSMAFETSGSQMEIVRAASNLSVNKLSWQGRLGFGPNGSIALDGAVKLADAHLTDTVLKTRISGIDVRLPIKWPAAGAAAQGSITVKTSGYKDINLGPTTAAIRFQRDAIRFSGNFVNRVLPGLDLNFSGAVPFSIGKGGAVEIEFSSSSDKPNVDIPLKKIITDLEGVDLNGKIDLHGTVKWANGRLGGFAAANFQNGRLVYKDNLVIDGIHVACHWPDLNGLFSAAQQTFHFDKASIGNIILNGGDIDFKIDSPDSVFIEKGTLHWCDGKVHTYAVRIPPPESDYNLVFYCDRLKLSELLKQVGTFKADGNGTVNGRIPLRLYKKNISFDDAFLYSTPGQGGSIHLTGTQMLTAGVTPGTSHHAQIELAREALKDYTYTWVKLHLTSKNEQLLFKMQFDGKPTHRLPFIFKKDVGGFVKTRTVEEGSLFQGIRLDVNFNLPLNKILFYGSKLK